jgi:transposase
MLQLTPQMRILLAVEPVDFRKGIDALAAVCRQRLASDPFSGTLFVFRNRRATAIRVFCFDGQGYWLCHKRLSEGKFRWWPKAGEQSTDSLAVHELQLLLWNGDPKAGRVAPVWKRVATG